ncbi:hypothetical protein ABZ816_22030 [Actinosynnema sp. NPDC047251]|nr:hypothetical protein [Saccharothrix espanaensis]
MTDVEWRLRVAGAADADLVAAFRCASDDRTWQVQVERFVRSNLLDWASDPRAASDDPRALLLLVADELVGVAAHEKAVLTAAGGCRVSATKLQVAALAEPWQGKCFAAGDRASDVLMSAVLTDVRHRRPPRHSHVFAVVHEENHRSLALLARYGLTEDLSRPHPRYRRVITSARRPERDPARDPAREAPRR